MARSAGNHVWRKRSSWCGRLLNKLTRSGLVRYPARATSGCSKFLIIALVSVPQVSASCLDCASIFLFYQHPDSTSKCPRCGQSLRPVKFNIFDDVYEVIPEAADHAVRGCLGIASANPCFLLFVTWSLLVYMALAKGFLSF